MAVTYQSIASAAIGDASLVIPKPTGLAVGDTMLAGIFHNDDDAGGGSIATPSGWTLLINEDNTGENLKVFSKEADSADVAASDFTFTSGGASYHLIGSIVRISDFGLVAGQSSELDTNIASATVIAPTFTPTRANTLFVAFFTQSRTGGSPAITSIEMATDNPTWTQRAETSFNDTTYDSILGVYTAPRVAMTATGNITATFSATAAGNIRTIGVLSISSQVDGSINPTTYVNAYAINPNIDFGAEVDAIVEDATYESNDNTTTNWVNDTKPTTVWTNETL